MPSSASYNLRHLGDVCGGDHVCFLCNSVDEKWRVLSEFYSTGLKNNEKILFFQHNTPVEEALQKLEEGGITEIRECAKSGQFQVLHYTEVYTVNGVFVCIDLFYATTPYTTHTTLTYILYYQGSSNYDC